MSTKQKGKVWLVGAGPGDGGLLTLKGKEALSAADVVLYDKLVGYGILAMIPREAELIDVGKRAGNHPVPQAEINRLILEKALEGKRVVRLKGGDPFLFGRGGEELELLQEHGVSFEIVPGVTSAISVPAYNGIPVTHRDFCSSVHIVTGHTKKDGRPSIDFEALIKTEGTLVFLMGLTALPSICQGLLDAGMDPDMPAAVLERGTTSGQRRVVSTVRDLTLEAEQAKIKSPAIIVVGKVCALSHQFCWAEKRELSGLRILVTRPENSASALTSRLAALGAEVIEFPTIRTEALEETPELLRAFDRLNSYSWAVFTSPKGVAVFFDKLWKAGRDIRQLSGLKFAAAGKATAKAIEDRGIRVELIPSVYDGAHLGALLAKEAEAERPVLIPRAKRGTLALISQLEQQGIAYDDVPIYDTFYEDRHPFSLADLFSSGELCWAAFTSASTVEGFAACAKLSDYGAVNAVCIGEQTAQKAREYGMNPYVSLEATMDSLTECLISQWNRVKENGQTKESKMVNRS